MIRPDRASGGAAPAQSALRLSAAELYRL